MDKAYDHKKTEDRIYKDWEEKGYFKPEVNPNGKPYCIILPPPNANGALHFGHAMFTVEDILIRFKRMQGFSALWFPGTDHAGIETQFVFEKKLKGEGKSRFDFDRDVLYRMIHEYVEKNRGGIENQLRRLGFSLDWSREKYTLDPDITKLVYKTFKKLYDDGLVYRTKKLVNYCTFDGTSFSDLEVVYQEKESVLYFVKYQSSDKKYSVTVATTRPETMFGDTAVAVNPKDKRYIDLIGKKVIIPFSEREVPIISDETVDMKFGTGAVKVTPAHDPNDYEMGVKYNLSQITIIGFDGKMTKEAGQFEGLYAKQAREKVAEQLRIDGFLEKEQKIVHQVPCCYKCKNTIEPLLKEQWFLKVKPLAEIAIKAVKEEKIKIYPKNFEKIYIDWLENLRDWNISRQIVWGIRIPSWKCNNCQKWTVTEGDIPTKCTSCSSVEIEQDLDTFDTWFSSGQWPYLTLKTSVAGDFEKFYPTDVLETAYDILKAWVTRMVILGIYITGEVPFRNVLFHGIVNDPYGKKMSKSKGNVINPLELVDQYGADAVRFSLIYGNATGNDQVLSIPKLDASRKFTNKLWNIGRFIEMSKIQGSKLKMSSLETDNLLKTAKNKNDKEIIEKTQKVVTEITKNLERYNFNFAAETLYAFVWHEFADKYVEDVKKRIDENSFSILNSQFLILLKLLHPFMPFVTEEIYQKFKPGESIMISKWPEYEKKA